MLQHSVYYRFIFNNFDLDRYLTELKLHIPSEGNMRIFLMTDNQFKSHIVIDNNKPLKNEVPEAIIQL